MMHLVINATEVGRRRGGNERYITGLTEGLAALDHPLRVSLLTCDWGRPSDFPPVFRQVNVGPYRRLAFFLWQQTSALRRLNADWYLANFFLPPIMPCKGIAVVHDLSFMAHPEYFPWTVAHYMKWLTAFSIRRAHLVLTGSEFSRQELFRFFPHNQEKVAVTAYGVGSQFRPRTDRSELAADRAILSRYGIDEPYIMALGNIHPRKNMVRLLDAYLGLKASRKSVPAMVWGGLRRWDSAEILQQAHSAGVIMPGFIAQEDLIAFFRQSEMLVYPSLYEGFGLPPLEAMACGTPVVASNTTSLPEVVGDAALTVDPTDAKAIAGAMARLLDDSSLRERLVQSGIERAAQYTWKRTASDLVALLGH